MMSPSFESVQNFETPREELARLEKELAVLESAESRQAAAQLGEAGYGEHNEGYANQLATIRSRIATLRSESGISDKDQPRHLQKGYDPKQYGELDNYQK